MSNFLRARTFGSLEDKIICDGQVDRDSIFQVQPRKVPTSMNVKVNMVGQIPYCSPCEQPSLPSIQGIL